MRLTREIRFTLTPEDGGESVANSWGGWPSSDGLAPYLVLWATVSGPVDPRTGYLCNIAVIDRGVRDRVIPAIRSRWLSSDPGSVSCTHLLNEAGPALAEALPAGVSLNRLELRVTPYLAYALDLEKASMVSITQAFEFAAAHRLYCPELSDEENRAVFGKCTNPSGHGHNYVVEVTVEGEPDPVSGVVLPIGVLEQTVKTRVIDLLDHKHLNADCPEFEELIPSVENITRVVWSKLENCFAPARLARVRVYETPKTVAEYCGTT